MDRVLSEGVGGVEEDIGVWQRVEAPEVPIITLGGFRTDSRIFRVILRRLIDLSEESQTVILTARWLHQRDFGLVFS